MIYQKGFTLIEILVVIAIFIVIMAFGMSINLSAFTTNTLASEESKIVSILERARSHAMANMFESKYGVCYDSGNYIIFRERVVCLPLDANKDEFIPANTNIAAVSNFSTVFPAIVFNQLAGTTTSASLITVTITDGIKSKNITVNNEGAINW